MAKTATSSGTPIEALLREKRKFPPPKDFVRHANVNKPSIYKEAAKDTGSSPGRRRSSGRCPTPSGSWGAS
jgi:hypothetical protein